VTLTAPKNVHANVQNCVARHVLTKVTLPNA